MAGASDIHIMAGESQDGGDINNGGGAEETLSPKNRVKFLCSHGGRIVPRPIDGQLKYVGGETRVIAIPHDISLSGFVHPHCFLCSMKST